MALYHLGVDSTDSAELGMCTTYLGARLLDEFGEMDLVSAPELVRLNPNVPWKTRGNGAVCIRFRGPENSSDDIIGRGSALTEDLSVLEDPQTNPGLALLKGDPPAEIVDFYHKALHRIIGIDEARALADTTEIMYRTWKNGRGLIGAMAAIGHPGDPHTFETILYRDPKIRSRERNVDRETVRIASMDHPSTFFNFSERWGVLCIPRSPCPVILGMRGTDPGETLAAAAEIDARGVERWVTWMTNQHTDAHIEQVENLDSIPDHSSVETDLEVLSTPEYLPGGHLFFEAKDHNGNVINCGAYEPTKGFRKDLSGLIKGDRIRIWGGVRHPDGSHPRTVNLEKIRILHLEKTVISGNPRCRYCGGRMGSMGKGQGLRCKKCRRIDPDSKKTISMKRRDLEPGYLEPPPVAWRHLYRPTGLEPAVGTSKTRKWWGLDHP